jgi:hypothetical protein
MAAAKDKAGIARAMRRENTGAMVANGTVETFRGVRVASLLTRELAG